MTVAKAMMLAGVIVDHRTGKVAKTEPITGGDDPEHVSHDSPLSMSHTILVGTPQGGGRNECGGNSTANRSHLGRPALESAVSNRCSEEIV